MKSFNRLKLFGRSVQRESILAEQRQMIRRFIEIAPEFRSGDSPRKSADARTAEIIRFPAFPDRVA